MCNLWGKEKCIESFGETFADRYILEDKDEDGKIILKRVLKK